MKYKVGNRVKINSLDWYNENKSKSHGTVACGGKYFDYDMKEWCGKIMTILEAYQTCYIMKEDGAKDLWTDDMIEGLAEEENPIERVNDTGLPSEKDYCDKDLSLALKEAGYIGQGRFYYDLDKEPNKLRHFGIQVLTTRSAEALNFVLAVHLYEAQKFLRGKYIHVVPELGLIHRNKNGITHYYRVLVKNMNNGIIITLDNDRDDFESYEEALSEGIKEAVKILKEE